MSDPKKDPKRIESKSDLETHLELKWSILKRNLPKLIRAEVYELFSIYRIPFAIVIGVTGFSGFAYMKKLVISTVEQTTKTLVEQQLQDSKTQSYIAETVRQGVAEELKSERVREVADETAKRIISAEFQTDRIRRIVDETAVNRTKEIVEKTAPGAVLTDRANATFSKKAYINILKRSRNSSSFEDKAIMRSLRKDEAFTEFLVGYSGGNDDFSGCDKYKDFKVLDDVEEDRSLSATIQKLVMCRLRTPTDTGPYVKTSENLKFVEEGVHFIDRTESTPRALVVASVIHDILTSPDFNLNGKVRQIKNVPEPYELDKWIDLKSQFPLEISN